MNCRPDVKTSLSLLLLLLAVALVTLAVAGTAAAAADPGTTPISTGWTWDDGALLQPS